MSPAAPESESSTAPSSAVHPIAILDYSLCCALGMTKQRAAHALLASESGLRPSPFALPFPTLCGQVPEALAPLPEKLSRFETRQARLALAALTPIAATVRRSVERFGGHRVAWVLGSSNAGLDTTERSYAAHAKTGQLPEAFSMRDQHDFGAVLHMLQELAGTSGPAYFVSTACSSAGKAFAAGARLLRAGLADAVIVGGVDALCEMTLRGFRSLGVLAEEACKPFSLDRADISIGEGSAFFVLERADELARAEDLNPLARLSLLGWAETADAHHMTAPHPQGDGAERVMRKALARAGLPPSAIDLVNAHGTATAQGDSSEALAIARVFGSALPVVSTKGYTGHALGAAGAIEAALCLISLEHGLAPASLGAAPIDPELPVHVLTERSPLGERAKSRPTPNDGEPAASRARHVLSNSFAFGGSNVSLIFGGQVNSQPGVQP
jgi:3-oxoacyl-[acyl-carrier-protein] synthase-1